MPGLKELEHFRKELSNLGNERAVTAERGEVYEELPLPSAVNPATQINVDDLLANLGGSAASSSGLPPAGSSPSAGAEDDFGFPHLPSAEEFPGDQGLSFSSPEGEALPGDLSGFDDLLASLPLDLPETPEIPELPESPDMSDVSAADAAAPSAPEDFDSFGIPEDLLSGFATEIEEGRKEGSDLELPEFDAGFNEAGEAPDFGDLPDLEPLQEADDGSAPAAAVPSLPEADEEFAEMDFTPDFEKPAEPEPSGMESIPDDAFSIPDLGSDFDLDLGEKPGKSPETLPETDDFSSFMPDSVPELSPGELAAPDFGEGSSAIPDFDFSNIPGPETVSASPETPAPNPFGDDFKDFSIPDDLNIAEPEQIPGSSGPADGFDGFSLDEDFLKSSIDSSSPDSDDFQIPGFSDFTSGAAKAAGPSLSSMPDLSRKGGKKDIPLTISDEDFRKFLSLLSSFPLNLRIAVEEFIAGDAGSEHQKMELVHNVITDVPIRKIARFLEPLLERNIPIPKDFEKKTAEEYEREKSSLKYVLLNRILPIATLFTLAFVMAACVAILSYQFIWRPLSAESLYRRGYACIEDARYAQAIELFDRAVERWEKKQWYFRYARAFRDRKQFISAEQMYERLLYRFDNDRLAGLEYAEMLRTDLRNFEKAETILKRRVLDNYVNDSDALMLLGDTYLDWAEESPDKYEAARLCYANLIELYGKKDPYLARMLRYFVRTDNLKEVLVLKEHFMNKRAKIGAQDLVEMSGYLLDKRYNPRPGDSEVLRDQIEDVRKLLERAVKADDSVPEAHYNMGRFFIYNYKNDLAATALSEALRLFDEARTMSPKRVLVRIDAFRLSGELRADAREYLDAQKLYAQGITLYEDQRANRTVRQDRLVGALYADQADIDYFISGKLDNALFNYGKALEELQDTPSIRYRVGYIQYHLQDFGSAMESMLRAYAEKPDDRNLLYAYGNTLFRRGDYYAAQSYYERLMEKLESERLLKGIILPQARVDDGQFVEEYMHTANNLGVTLNRLAGRTGDSRKNGRALALLSESTRAWDTLTRNPETMMRAQGSNLAFLNIQNITHPLSAYIPEIYADIPRTLENEKVLQQRQ